MPQNRNDEQTATESRQDRESGQAAEEASRWFAVSAARLGLVFVGLVLLLFALGQAVGANLLGIAVQAATSRIGRWLLVAVFAVVLIAVAARWRSIAPTG